MAQATRKPYQNRSCDAATLRIVAEVLTIGEKLNVAEVVAADQADPDSTPGNDVGAEDDQDSARIDPPVVDLELDKTADTPRPSVGGGLSFTLVLRNEGPDRATGIVVQDQLPDLTTFVTSIPSVGSFDADTGNWSVPILESGGTATLEILTTVNDLGELENRAQVTAADQSDSDSTPGNDDGIDGNGNDEDDQAAVTVTTASADLSLLKSVDDDRPGVGSSVTFTLQPANEGPDPAQNVIVEDALPSGISFISSNPSTGTYNAASGQWIIPSIAGTATETLEIVARIDEFGERFNTAEVIASSEFDPDSTPGQPDPQRR